MKRGECSALLWSFDFLSKLMRAANYVCFKNWFCLNLFCRRVHEGYLPHDKNDSDKTSKKKYFQFISDFFQPPYTEPVALFMKFSTCEGLVS